MKYISELEKDKNEDRLKLGYYFGYKECLEGLLEDIKNNPIHFFEIEKHINNLLSN